MTPELSVVLPAYREALSLQQLLPALISSIAPLTSSYEILVIDAPEPLDETPDICRRLGVRHVPQRGGPGYGAAIRTGIQDAQGRYILIMDADGSHNPVHIQRLWRERENFDVVIGSRYVPGGQTENPLILIFLSWTVNAIFRLFFGSHAKDMSTSFRLYRAGLLKPLRLRSRNYDMVEEILILLSDRRIKEVPVTFEKRKAGESKRNLVLFAFGYLWTLARLLWIKLSS